MFILLSRLSLVCCLGLFAGTVLASDSQTPDALWQQAAEQGNYDEAVKLASRVEGASLFRLLTAARALSLAEDPQWRAFLHYKPTFTRSWRSQVDSPHFFLSSTGKHDPQTELDATLAAFFSDTPKAPLRLTAYCRFVARRTWLQEKLPEMSLLLPQRDCPEYERYVSYLDAQSLTLIFPTAHPNSPSSAFGHTLLRIDKKDQRAESRLLNMSINFAAEVPEGVSSAAYAIFGLSGGFPGRFRMLPYHMKLREYGQIENRDTWEYPLTLSRSDVDRVLRHAYEMLISDFDYFFFSENCSYHLLSLLEVADPETSLTDGFGLYTIPIDTIRLLKAKGLVEEGRFTGSSIRLLRARRDSMNDEDASLSLAAFKTELSAIDDALESLPPERQAQVLDLLSDYERYQRLKTDPRAQGGSDRERAILSRRSKLGIQSDKLALDAPGVAPDAGHDTSRVSLRYHQLEKQSDQVELQLRPAYHDFRDPSAAFDDKASIQMGVIGIARDLDKDKNFLRRLTLISIESIEPRGEFFKPVSWHTNLEWQRASPDSRHEFTFNVGAGAAFQANPGTPVYFMLGESDIIDAPAFRQRQQLRLGFSLGAHWEPLSGFRTGLEFEYRRQLGGDYELSSAEFWTGIALGEQLSLNLETSVRRQPGSTSISQATAELRFYF